MDQTGSFEAFCLSSANEHLCIRMLYDSRWPEGFRCPLCNHRNAYLITTRRVPLYQCSSCRTQTSLTSGTILEGSRTPIRLWLLALFLHAQPGGISAVQLTSLIGTTYKTSWLICHKIRHAMTQADQKDLLTGLVRINFARYGRPHNPTVFRHPQEHPLLIGGTLNEQGQFTFIKIKQVVEECFNPKYIYPLTEMPFIHKHVDPQAIEVITIIQEFSKLRNKQLIQICKDAGSWINKTFSGIGAKHLQTYLNQFCFSYNLASQDRPVFSHLLKISVTTATLTYPELISKPNNQPQIRSQYEHLLRMAS
jgi:transposase-like protein